MSNHACCHTEHHCCCGYKGLVCIGSFLAPLLLLTLRVFFGVLFVLAGLGKLVDAAPTAEYFAGLGIPMSLLLAYIVGLFELVCGALLAIGFASRLVAIPLIVIMIVAYITSSKSAIDGFMMDPTLILVEKPFGFLLTSLLVFCFGPGMISLDYLLERFVCKNQCDKD